MTAPSVHSEPGPDEIGDLIAQIADLRRRVLNLEKRLDIVPEEPVAAPATPVRGLDLSPGIVPVMGRMLVVIAGAYVLRALTEWKVVPPAIGVTLGLVYGLIWLFIAARAPEGTPAAKLSGIVNCCTSVLIVTPLVWEATLHLKVLPDALSAAVLAGFSSIALGLSWKTGHTFIATIASSSSIVMAIALLIASNDIVPFTTALLVIAIGIELAVWFGQQPGARALAAIAADFSVLLFSWLMSSPRGMPESWVPAPALSVLAAQILLAVLFTATAVFQTVFRRRTLALPEVFQTAVALLIGVGGAAWDFKDHRPTMLVLGLVALAAGLASYALSFRMFEQDNKWNFRAWSGFGLFLALGGIYLPFSRTGFWVLGCICAAVCCWTARAFRLPTLSLHGAVYLALGSVASGATGQSLNVLFGGAAAIEWRSSIAVLIAGVAAWAAVARISSEGTGRWRTQASSLAIAGHLTWIAAGLTAHASVGIWRAVLGGNTSIPADTLATLVLTAYSLTVAWLATNRERREFAWLLYGLVAICGYKLAVRDFRSEHNIALVISLLAYGGLLILLPRLLRASPPKLAADNPRSVDLQ